MSSLTFDGRNGLEAGNGVLNVEDILLLTDEPFPEIISSQISDIILIFFHSFWRKMVI